MKSWFSLRSNRLFLVYLFLLHGVGLAVALHTGAIALRDTEEYLHVAHNLADGVYYSGDIHLPWNPDFVSRRPPVYPLFIAAIESWSNNYVVLLAQMFVSIATLSGISILLQERFGFAPSVNRVIAVAVFLSPVQIFYANFLMAEIVFQALVFWMFYACVSYYYDRRSRSLLWASLLLCAGLLTKPVLFLLWVPALLIGAVLAWKARRWSIALYGVLPLVVVIGWCTCNYAWTSYYHFSSMKKTNLLSYNTHALLVREHGVTFADSVVDAVQARAATIEDYGQRVEYTEREAMAWLRRYPAKYAILHAQGVLNVFLDPGRFDVYTLFSLPADKSASLLRVFSGQGGYGGIVQRIGQLPLGVLFYLAVVFSANIGFLFSLVYFGIRGRCPTAIRALVFAIVLYIAGITGQVGAARYRSAIVPLLLFAVPFAVEAWKVRRGMQVGTHGRTGAVLISSER